MSLRIGVRKPDPVLGIAAVAHGEARPSHGSDVNFRLITERKCCRGYVVKEKRALVPTSKGRMLAAFLQKFFSKWVDFQFTCGMEERLDDISAGNGELHAFLATFWRELDQSLQDVDGVTVQQVQTALMKRIAVGCIAPVVVGLLV